MVGYAAHQLEKASRRLAKSHEALSSDIRLNGIVAPCHPVHERPIVIFSLVSIKHVSNMTNEADLFATSLRRAVGAYRDGRQNLVRKDIVGLTKSYDPNRRLMYKKPHQHKYDGPVRT